MYSRQMHKGANKQTNQLNKNGSDITVLNFCYQTLFGKKFQQYLRNANTK